jgi:hypothetical protein
MQPDDSGAARTLARLDAERAVPEALEMHEHSRTAGRLGRGPFGRGWMPSGPQARVGAVRGRSNVVVFAKGAT